MTAGRAIDLRGGALGGTWVRVGQQGSSADVTLRAPTLSFRGGGAGNTYAELVGGAEGSITVAASERIVFANGAGDQGRVQAPNGASLTLRAPVQVWDGPVRAGSGAQDGGETVIAGAVSASFQPQFSLRRGANFTNETNLRLGMKVPSIRTRTQNLFGVLALDWQDSANVTGFGPDETTEDDRLLVLAAGAEWDRADRFGGVTLAKATIRQGLDTFRSFIGGGPSYGVDAFPFGALELSRLQRLGDGPWALWLEGIGQYAWDILPNSERFSLGGSTIGRGFAPGDTTGDSGYGGRIELRHTVEPARLGRAAEGMELYAYGDWGQAYDRDGDRDGQGWETLGSAGIGARIDVNRWLTITPEIARQLHGVPTDTTDPDHETRFYISLVARF